MAAFCRFELRTTDVPAARAFYGALLGHDRSRIVQLPEAAAQRGAPAHWLAQLGVADVELAVATFVAHGATRLGPTRVTDDGEVAIVRDPGGAVVAIANATAAPSPEVVGYHLDANDLAAAAAAYRASFGWHIGEPTMIPRIGACHPFAWHDGGRAVGSVASTVGRPGVHAHWLLHFAVPALEPAVARVRAAGGLVIEALANGERIAVCDDPQGAAFALCERPVAGR